MTPITKTTFFFNDPNGDAQSISQVLPLNEGDEMTFENKTYVIVRIDWDFDNGVMYVLIIDKRTE